MNRNININLVVLVLAATAATNQGASAQPVYRCDAHGKVTYTHEPCLNAREVDTTPTQGLDKASGKSRKRSDVRAAEHNKAMADALRPILNETPEERQRRHRRAKLPPADRSECGALDGRLQAARSEQELFGLRKRYRELRC